MYSVEYQDGKATSHNPGVILGQPIKRVSPSETLVDWLSTTNQD